MLIIGNSNRSSAVSVFSLKHIYKDKTVLFILGVLLLVIMVIVIDLQVIKNIEVGSGTMRTAP